MQLFRAPSVVHELAREPVEQFRMRRCFDARAEVLGRVHDAVAEVGLPDAVHERPRGRRRFAVHQPFRQREARTIRVGRQRMEE